MAVPSCSVAASFLVQVPLRSLYQIVLALREGKPPYLFVSGFSSQRILIFRSDPTGQLVRQPPLRRVAGPNQALPTDLDGGAIDRARTTYAVELVTKTVSRGGVSYAYFDQAKALRE